jgi:hypothetical protein
MSEELRLPAREISASNDRPACLNCGAPLGGPFCSECGQRDIPPYPSTRELAVDAISEFSGWDGRLASTIRALVTKPGVLTLEFLEGRRVRYISPLRLYLTASVIYFLLAAGAPSVRLGEGVSLTSGLQVSTTSSTTKTSRPQRVADAARESLDQQELTQQQKDSALADIARAPSVMRPFLRRAVEDPAGFKRGILENMPRMLFVLLPVFAGIIAIFYRHRKYPEHLYFAIHLYAFIFVALGFSELAKFARLTVIAGIASALVVLAIPIYSTLAFRRVYGGTLGLTILKELAIALIYGVVSTVAFTGMLYWVSVAG